MKPKRTFRHAKKMLHHNLTRNGGHTHCQHCGTSQSIRWDVHHIVYRSEKPKHEHLNNERNLIVVCVDCHSEFHKHKHAMREKYIEKRRLTELFGNSILPINYETQNPNRT